MTGKKLISRHTLFRLIFWLMLGLWAATAMIGRLHGQGSSQPKPTRAAVSHSPFAAIGSRYAKLMSTFTDSLGGVQTDPRWDMWNLKQFQRWLDSINHHGPDIGNTDSANESNLRIVLLWDDHFEAILGGGDAFSAGAASSVPQGERILLSSIIRGLNSMQYCYMVVNSPSMTLHYYSIFADHFVTTFTGVYKMMEAAETGGFYDAMPRCRFLIVDFWGTMPGVKDDVLQAGFHLKQYLTPYPSNYVNTFLGFIQDPCAAATDSRRKSREFRGLIWGKEPWYFTDGGWNRKVFERMQIAFPSLRLFATCKLQEKSAIVPDGVTNLAPMSRPDFLVTLASMDFFFGLGIPHDGPSVLEAWACGCPYINPVTSADTSDVHRRKIDILNSQLLDAAEKSRLMFQRQSQHQYAESFSAPIAYHVRQNDYDGVINVLAAIIKAGPIDPFIPPEYQEASFILRLRRILETDWCA